MSVPDIYRQGAIEPAGVALTPHAPSGGGGDRLDFRSLVSTFRRRVMLFAIVGGLIAAATLYVTLTQTPQYTANARVMLNVRQQDAAPKGQNEMQTQTSAIDTNGVDTEVEIIRSRTLARLVSDELKLDRDPYYNPEAPGPKQKPGRLAPAQERHQIYFGAHQAERSGCFRIDTGSGGRCHRQCPRRFNDAACRPYLCHRSLFL